MPVKGAIARREESSTPGLRRSADHRSWPAVSFGLERGGIPWTPDGARPGCEPALGTDRGPWQAPGEPVRSARRDQGALAPRRHAIGRAYERGFGSRSHTRGGGWRLAALARGSRAVTDPQRATEQAQPKCRDRSPIFPVLLQLLQELAEGHDRLAGRRPAGWQDRGGDPSLADGFSQHGVGHQRATALAGWHQFRDDTIPVGDQDCFPARDQANVFAELVLEDFQANRPHAYYGSFQKLLSSTLFLPLGPGCAG